MSDQFRELEYSIIGKNTFLKGEIFLEGPTYLLGKIEGDVKHTGNSLLTIGEGAKLTGNLECQDVEIKGHINGTINSSGNVEILPPAIVQGKIESKTLSIKPGSKVSLTGKTNL